MKTILSSVFLFISTIFYVIIGVIMLLIWTPTVAITRIFDWSGGAAHVLARWYFAVFLAMMRVKIELEGRENLSKNTSYLIISNHKSSMDILVLGRELPVHFKFFAARYLFSIPLLGWIMSMAGYVPVERSHKRKAYKSVMRSIEILKKGKAGLLIFPEGTRTELPEIQSLKSGFIRIARETKQPILPVILDGTSDIKKKNEFWYRPAHVSMKILPPIQTAEFTDEDWGGLKDKIEYLFREEYAVLHQKHIAEINA